MPTPAEFTGRPRRSLLLAAVCALAAASVACGSSSVTSVAAPAPPRCQVTVAGGTADFPSAGGNGSVQVTTDRDCQWTATSGASWIALSGTTSGQGNGTFQFAVAPNAAVAPRSAGISVNGQSFGVSQQAAPPPPPPPRPSACSSATVSPKSQSFPSSGGTGTVSVSGTSPAGCVWTATSGAEWLSITSGSSGTGNGTVSYTVAANHGGARSTTLTIGGQAVTVDQASGKTKG